MILGHLLNHQQTDAGALGSLGREEVLEDLAVQVLGNPGAVVLDLEDRRAVPVLVGSAE